MVAAGLARHWQVWWEVGFPNSKPEQERPKGSFTGGFEWPCRSKQCVDERRTPSPPTWSLIFTNLQLHSTQEDVTPRAAASINHTHYDVLAGLLPTESPVGPEAAAGNSGSPSGTPVGAAASAPAFALASCRASCTSPKTEVEREGCKQDESACWERVTNTHAHKRQHRAAVPPPSEWQSCARHAACASWPLQRRPRTI